MTADILVYQDYVHNQQILFNALVRHFGADNVAFCDADAILNWGLNSDVKLFVMPGGADLYYCEKLNGEGNVRIRAWAEGGGTYLGICAGAYYACSRLEWAMGTHQQIAGARELDFFKGTAVGPLPELIENQSIDGSWDGIADIIYDDGTFKTNSAVFYSGGPFFTDLEDSNAKVLAYYNRPDGPAPAIIECPVGKGKAVLVSPHLESDPQMRQRTLYRHNNSSFDRQSSLVYELQKAGTEQQAIWEAVLGRCLKKPL